MGVNEKDIIGETHDILLNNKVDGNYDDTMDTDLHIEQIIDHDEDYENEDPEEEEDIENEITDEELLEKEKEFMDEYDDNRVSSGTSLSNSYFKPVCVSNGKLGTYFKILYNVTSLPFINHLSIVSFLLYHISVILIVSLLMSSSNILPTNYNSDRFSL